MFDTVVGMRSRKEYDEVMSMVADGLNNSQIARETGISRTTVREWRRGDVSARILSGNNRNGRRCDGNCGLGEQRSHDWPAIYAHLLGLYLGDGTITHHRRGVMRLRVFLDDKYPRIIEGCVGAMMVIRGSERVATHSRSGCTAVSSYWKHWPCVFPQHGPGMKHTRPIVLDSWQRSTVQAQPEQFLRGLIESDGTRHINTVRRPVAGRIKAYRYSRYMFSNASDDIRDMFTDACNQLGIQWTRTSEREVAVSRRDDVHRLDEFIGPKR